jgi:hypothetical protein
MMKKNMMKKATVQMTSSFLTNSNFQFHHFTASYFHLCGHGGLPRPHAPSPVHPSALLLEP